MESKRKAQLTKPVKLSNPDVHEKNESLGLWHLKVKKIVKIVVKIFFLERSRNLPKLGSKIGWEEKKNLLFIARHIDLLRKGC